MKWQTQGTPAQNIQKRSRQRQTTSKAEMPEHPGKLQQHSKRLKHVGLKWQPQDANRNSKLENWCSSSTLNQFHRLPSRFYWHISCVFNGTLYIVSVYKGPLKYLGGTWFVLFMSRLLGNWVFSVSSSLLENDSWSFLNFQLDVARIRILVLLHY